MKEIDPIVKKLMVTAEKVNFPRKTSLINEGDVCKQIYFIEQGCLRSWLNDDGNDITFQFFFEGEFVSSLESLWKNQPCLYNMETITPATLYVIHRDVFLQAVEKSPELKEKFNERIFQRFYHYQKLFISRITKSPQRRYEELVKENPEVFRRVPQHYIATYLGITPVSLSRIINKKK